VELAHVHAADRRRRAHDLAGPGGHLRRLHLPGGEAPSRLPDPRRARPRRRAAAGRRGRPHTMNARSREHFYDSIADRFEGLDHPADLTRRLHIVFDACLRDASLAARRPLEAGCGYGRFSRAASSRGAAVLSVDIGWRLVAAATARADSRGIVADACELPVRDASVDVVISSEMLEHTR